MSTEKTWFFHTPEISKPSTGKITKRYTNEIVPARYTIAGKFNGGTLDLSFAKCSKKDQFSKKIGRLIAEGRLTKRKTEYLVNVPLKEGDKADGHYFLTNAIKLIQTMDPEWSSHKLTK